MSTPDTLKHGGWLSIARKHGYAFPDAHMEAFVGELLTFASPAVVSEGQAVAARDLGLKRHSCHKDEGMVEDSVGGWVSLYELERVLARPAAPAPEAPAAAQAPEVAEITAEQARAELMAMPLDEVVKLVRGAPVAEAPTEQGRAQQMLDAIEEAAALCMARSERYEAARHETGIDPESENVRRILSEEFYEVAIEIRALRAAPATKQADRMQKARQYMTNTHEEFSTRMSDDLIVPASGVFAGPTAEQAKPYAEYMAFNPHAKCSPTLTQCPRCNNPHNACDHASPAKPKLTDAQVYINKTVSEGLEKALAHASPAKPDLSDEQIEAIFHALDGKKLIVGENSLNWNKVVRLAFARSLIAAITKEPGA